MHYAPKHSRSRRFMERRWPRRVLISVNVVVAATLVAAGFGYGYVRYRLGSIHTVAVKGLTPDAKATARGLPPENVLLIGNQSRACLTTAAEKAQFGDPALLSGSLSDVIMVMHLDPKTRSGSVLSIPRDLFEAMPPATPSGPYEKIDAALNDGANGPANLITAIQNDLGIAINHYVEVNFCGFQQTVNSLGGIKMDFPEPLWDQESLLNVSQTGCQLVNGAEALALVRSRHLQYDPPNVPATDRAAWPSDPESDLARITRDHQFLRVLINTAQRQGLYSPLKLNSFLSALTSQVTMDPGLRNQLIDLAGAYRNVSADNLPETTLPVTTYSNYVYDGYHLGDVDFAVEPADHQVIRAWDPQAMPTPLPPSAVEVYNAVGSAHLAADTGGALTADGIRVTTESDTPALGHPAETLVRYSPGQTAQGLYVMQDFSGAVTIQPDPHLPPGTVRVDVGTNEAVATQAASMPGGVPQAAGLATAAAPPPTGVAATSATTRAATPTTAGPNAVPTVGGVAPSSSNDHLTPYDPRPC